MAITKTQIISMAFELLGNAQIMSLNPESNPHHASASRFYDQELKNILTMHPWRFAMKTRDLIADFDDPTNERWRYKYVIPLDVLSIYKVNVFGYTIFDDRIYANVNSLQIDCLEEVSTDKFPPYFVTLLVYRLAELLSLKITQKTDLAKYWSAKADQQYIRARTIDINQVPSQVVSYDPIYSAHFV